MSSGGDSSSAAAKVTRSIDALSRSDMLYVAQYLLANSDITKQLLSDRLRDNVFYCTPCHRLYALQEMVLCKEQDHGYIMCVGNCSDCDYQVCIHHNSDEKLDFSVTTCPTCAYGLMYCSYCVGGDYYTCTNCGTCHSRRETIDSP